MVPTMGENSVTSWYTMNSLLARSGGVRPAPEGLFLGYHLFKAPLLEHYLQVRLGWCANLGPPSAFVNKALLEPLLSS